MRHWCVAMMGEGAGGSAARCVYQWCGRHRVTWTPKPRPRREPIVTRAQTPIASCRRPAAAVRRPTCTALLPATPTGYNSNHTTCRQRWIRPSSISQLLGHTSRQATLDASTNRLCDVATSFDVSVDAVLAGRQCADDSALNYDWLRNVTNNVLQKHWLWTIEHNAYDFIGAIIKSQSLG